MYNIEDIKNTVVEGDCVEVLRKIPDNSIDLVVTSPPYNCGIKYDRHYDKMVWEDYYDWCTLWLGEIYRVLKDDGRFCLNHYLSLGDSLARHTPLMTLNTLALNLGFKHQGIAIWTDITLTKRTAWGSWLSASSPYINSPYEGILILYKNDWKKYSKGESTINKEDFMMACSGVWKIHPANIPDFPAPFPVRLPKLCIELLTYVGDIILDPFMGSGTTGVAAVKSKRNYIGIELSPDYCKLARDNIKAELDINFLFS